MTCFDEAQQFDYFLPYLKKGNTYKSSNEIQSIDSLLIGEFISLKSGKILFLKSVEHVLCHNFKLENYKKAKSQV